MPRYKITDKDRKKVSHIKMECPCITNALIAYIFDISPSRVGEILREDSTGREGFKEFAKVLESLDDE